MEMKEIITAAAEVKEYYESNNLNDYLKKFLRHRINYLVSLLEERSMEMEKDTSIFINDIVNEYEKVQELIEELLKIKYTLI